MSQGKEKHFLIGIDLGANHSGIFITEKNSRSSGNEAVLFELDKDDWTLALNEKRTPMRHARRSRKRRKLAKKLFLFLSRCEWGIDWKQTECYDFLLGLFNRRGYTYKQEEEQKKNERNKKSSGEEDYGVHRKEYLDQIKDEIMNNTCLENCLSLHDNGKLDKQDLWKIIGNINNLPLKPLRRFFNKKEFWNFFGSSSGTQEKKISCKKEQEKKISCNEEQEKKISCNEEKIRLLEIYRSWLKSWRPADNEERKRKKELLESLNEKNNVIEFWKDTDPEKTIPPYENQNNRKPLRCQSLRLNEKYLQDNYSGWDKIFLNILSLDAVKQSELFREDKESYREAKENHDRVDWEETLKYVHDYLTKANKNLAVSEMSLLLHLYLEQTAGNDPLHWRKQYRVLKELGEDGFREFLARITNLNHETKHREAVSDGEKNS